MGNLPQNNRAQTAGTGFVNLQRVLQANKNNNLGQTVAGGVQQAGQAARGALNTAGQQFQAGLGQEKQRLNEAGQRVGNVLGNIPGASDDDVKAFEGIRAGEFKGPTGLKNANELQSQAQEAQSLGQAGGSEAGRFGLLQRFVGRGQQYTGGQQRLDNLLLGQQGGKQLQQARAGTVGLGGQIDRGIQGAAAQGQEGQNQARGLAENTISQLGGAVTDYDKAMQDQLASKQGAINQILGQFSGTGTNAAIDLDANRLAQLKEASNGVLDEGTQLFNTDISPFVKANELFATKQGAQSDADFAKAQMIGKLSGQSLAGKEQGNVLQDYLGRADQVGTFDKNNPFSVNSQSDLAAAVAKQKDDYDAQTATQNALIANNQAILHGQGLTNQQAIDRGLGTPGGVGGDFIGTGLYGKLANIYNSLNTGGPTNPSADPNFSPSHNLQDIKDFAANFRGAANSPDIVGLLNRINSTESGIPVAEAQKQALDKQFNILRTLKSRQAAGQPNSIIASDHVS